MAWLRLTEDEEMELYSMFVASRGGPPLGCGPITTSVTIWSDYIKFLKERFNVELVGLYKEWSEVKNDYVEFYEYSGDAKDLFKLKVSI